MDSSNKLRMQVECKITYSGAGYAALSPGPLTAFTEYRELNRISPVLRILGLTSISESFVLIYRSDARWRCLASASWSATMVPCVLDQHSSHEDRIRVGSIPTRVKDSWYEDSFLGGNILR